MSLRTVLACLLALPFAFLAAGCRRHAPSNGQTLLDVSAIEAPKEATAGEFFTLQVVGTKPDPAWRYRGTDVATRPNEVTFTIRGARDPKQLSAQVITPYRAPQRIRKLTPGRLTIVAVGRNGRFTTTVRVEAPRRPS